jgi:hypothetical protein
VITNEHDEFIPYTHTDITNINMRDAHGSIHFEPRENAYIAQYKSRGQPFRRLGTSQEPHTLVELLCKFVMNAQIIYRASVESATDMEYDE